MNDQRITARDTQRVIKFRCWDHEEGVMLSDNHDGMMIQMNSGRIGHYDDDGNFQEGKYTIMQFTGLLDKHGKEIYHNDFIKSNGGDIMLVVWREDLASFALRKEGWMYDHYFGEAVDAGATEIIGNIYTTPELVDPKMIEHGNS